MIERRPLLLALGAAGMAVHHFSSVSLGGQAFGCKLGIAVQVAISLHERFVNLRSLKRCMSNSARILWSGRTTYIVFNFSDVKCHVIAMA